MNTIKTVADLRKALSAYPGHLPVEWTVVTNRGQVPAHLNSDIQIMHIDASNVGGAEFLSIMPVVEGNLSR
jgi:hypothetical protein